MLDMCWQPFVEFAFMRRALIGGVALALSAGPLGVFLILRRMSLIGDAVAHHDPQPPHVLCPAVPSELSQITLRAMARDPAEARKLTDEYGERFRALDPIRAEPAPQR